MFKLLVIDIDGVMTNGTKAYDQNSKVIFKSFCDLDFTAIKMFKKIGVQVCFLSGDARINLEMAADRQIPFWNARLEDNSMNKSVFAQKLSNYYNVQPKDIAYVGDDLYDIPLLKLVGYSFCPSQSPLLVRQCVTKVLQKSGGTGVISEILDYCIRCFGISIPDDYFIEQSCEVEINNKSNEITVPIEMQLPRWSSLPRYK